MMKLDSTAGLLNPIIHTQVSLNILFNKLIISKYLFRLKFPNVWNETAQNYLASYQVLTLLNLT